MLEITIFPVLNQQKQPGIRHGVQISVIRAPQALVASRRGGSFARRGLVRADFKRSAVLLRFGSLPAVSCGGGLCVQISVV